MAFRSGAAGFVAFSGATAAGFAVPTSFNFFWGSKKKTDEENKGNDKNARAQGSNGGLRFINGVCLIPHDDKVYKGGEDAYTASDRLIAVADGVGGWASKGIDPGLFSKQLTKDIQLLFD